MWCLMLQVTWPLRAGRRPRWGRGARGRTLWPWSPWSTTWRRSARTMPLRPRTTSKRDTAQNWHRYVNVFYKYASHKLKLQSLTIPSLGWGLSGWKPRFFQGLPHKEGVSSHDWQLAGGPQSAPRSLPPNISQVWVIHPPHKVCRVERSLPKLFWFFWNQVDIKDVDHDSIKVFQVAVHRLKVHRVRGSYTHQKNKCAGEREKKIKPCFPETKTHNFFRSLKKVVWPSPGWPQWTAPRPSSPARATTTQPSWPGRSGRSPGQICRV